MLHPVLFTCSNKLLENLLNLHSLWMLHLQPTPPPPPHTSLFSPVNTAMPYAMPTPAGPSSAAGSGGGMFSAPPAHTGSALSLMQSQSMSVTNAFPQTPMTPATPASEGSGILPQLQ